MDFTTRSGFVITAQSSDVASFPMDLGTFVPVGYVTSLGVTLVSKLWLLSNVNMSRKLYILDIHKQITVTIQQLCRGFDCE